MVFHFPSFLKPLIRVNSQLDTINICYLFNETFMEDIQF